MHIYVYRKPSIVGITSSTHGRAIIATGDYHKSVFDVTFGLPSL